MISVQNVHKSFGDLEVLKGVSLDVKKGEVVSVIGGSGSGKSTLLYCINAIEPINKGKILVDDVDVHAKETNKDKLRQKLGKVFQQWNSFPHMTVLENAALAPRIVKKMSKEEAIEIAKKELEHVGLGDKFDVYPTKMSGGQQQRLVIARAIAVNPEVILMDEPASALDPIATAKVEELIDELAGRYAIVIVTHSMQQAARVSQRTAFFHLGKMVEYGPTDQIFTNPLEERTKDYITGRYG